MTQGSVGSAGQGSEHDSGQCRPGGGQCSAAIIGRLSESKHGRAVETTLTK